MWWGRRNILLDGTNRLERSNNVIEIKFFGHVSLSSVSRSYASRLQSANRKRAG